MNIVLAMNQKRIKEAIALELIPEGMLALDCNSIGELTELLPDISPFAIIDEDSFPKREIFETIHTIKKKIEANKIKLALLSKNTLQSYIKVLNRFGVDLVIPSTMEIETIALNVLNFIKKVCDKNKNLNEKRKYVRLSLKESSNTSLKMFAPEISSYLEAKLTDISMGGIAAEFQNNKLEFVNNNEYFKRTQIKLENNTIFADMKLMKRSDTIAAFHFSHINENYKKILAGFIFQKTQQVFSR